MRRKDREITDCGKIMEIVGRCSVCRLGFYDGREVYIVPLSFGYEAVNGKLTLYFHGAKEGRKMDLIRNTAAAGFEMDTDYTVNPGETPCAYSASFSSVIGTGRIKIIETAEEKEHALQKLMLQTAVKAGWRFTEAMLASVCVFKMEVEGLSCKSHL